MHQVHNQNLDLFDYLTSLDALKSVQFVHLIVLHKRK
jgi:hypothetical protein